MSVFVVRSDKGSKFESTEPSKLGQEITYNTYKEAKEALETLQKLFKDERFEVKEIEN